MVIAVGIMKFASLRRISNSVSRPADDHADITMIGKVIVKEEEPKELSVLEEENFKEFIEMRKISPEDFKTIENLSHYPGNFFVLELHNLFSFNKERSEGFLENRIKELEKYIKETQDEKEKFVLGGKKKFLNSFLEITKKYDWTTSWHLTSIFERREKQTNYFQWLNKEWISKHK